MEIKLCPLERDNDNGDSGSVESGLSSRRTVKPYEKTRRFSKTIYENKDNDNDWDDGNVE